MKNIFHLSVGYFLVALIVVVPQIASAVDWKVSGADQELASNIQLSLGELNGGQGLSAAAYNRRLELAITRAGQALGYYQLSYTIEGDEQNRLIQVEPGDRVLWNNISIEILGAGSKEKSLVDWRRKQAFKTHDAIHHGVYEKYKNNGLQRALHLGYLDAHYVVHKLTVNVSDLKADIHWQLDTGQLHTVNSVRFHGSSLQTDVLERLNPVKTGEPYRARLLADIYGRFTATGYFGDVKVNPVGDGETGQIIDVSLQDANYHQFTTGLGFSTDTGPRVRLGWAQPQVNKYGHQWFNDMRLSAIEQSLASEYRVPITDPLSHYLSFDTGWRRKVNEDTNSRQLNMGVGWHRLFDSGWQRTYKLDLEREDYKQGSEPRTTALYVIPGVNLSLTQYVGSIRNPDKGYKIWAGLSGSAADLGADHDFIRLKVGGKYLYAFLPEHVLVARMELGAISTSRVSEVPSSQRFFTGGDQSVRGYDYESLAPKSEDGKLIGGRYLNIVSAEYRWRYSEKWHWALFYDVGRAFTEPDESWSKGAGTGWHWQSPIGPVRFDVAWPIDNEHHSGLQLHISMGPSI